MFEKVKEHFLTKSESLCATEGLIATTQFERILGATQARLASDCDPEKVAKSVFVQKPAANEKA